MGDSSLLSALPALPRVVHSGCRAVIYLRVFMFPGSYMVKLFMQTAARQKDLGKDVKMDVV